MIPINILLPYNYRLYSICYEVSKLSWYLAAVTYLLILKLADPDITEHTTTDNNTYGSNSGNGNCNELSSLWIITSSTGTCTAVQVHVPVLQVLVLQYMYLYCRYLYCSVVQVHHSKEPRRSIIIYISIPSIK